jgi:ribosome-binding protein aMBF1 (putative translation factor)
MTKRKSQRSRTQTDDLDDFIAERTRVNPEFPKLMEAAAARKKLLGDLCDARKASGLTQTEVAARMETSASTVARLERGEINPTLSTVQRFAAAVGKQVTFRLAPRS